VAQTVRRRQATRWAIAALRLRDVTRTLPEHENEARNESDDRDRPGLHRAEMRGASDAMADGQAK